MITYTNLSIEFIIVAVYLLISLWQGLYYGRKVQDVHDFAISKGQHSFLMLFMTFAATSIGAGSTIGDVAKVAKEGIIFLLSISGFLVFCLYMAVSLHKFFDARFTNMTSAGDMMLHFYGQKASKITALSGFFFSILTVGGQLTAIGYLFEQLSEWSNASIVISAGLILVLYSSIGGMKSIVATDALQFCIIITVLPYLGCTLLEQTGGIFSVISSLPPNKTLIFEHEKFTEFAALFLVSTTPFLWLHPALIQRCLMARNNKKYIKNIHIAQIIIRIFLLLMVACTAFSGIVIFPETSSEFLVGKIIAELLGPVGKGMVLICILAASMSTADSHLHASTILVANHLLPTKDTKKKLREMQLISAIIGCFAIFIATFRLDIIDVMITAFGIWGAMIAVPILAGILKWRTHPLAFWLCFASTCVTLLFFVVFPMQSNLFLPSILVIASAAAMLLYQIAGALHKWQSR